MRVEEESTWKALAACRPDAGVDPATATERFYPKAAEGRGGKRTNLHAPAKAVCAQCPVRGDCLHAALERDEGYGVWGQLDASERRRIKPRVVLDRIPRQVSSITISQARTVAAYRIEGLL